MRGRPGRELGCGRGRDAGSFGEPWRGVRRGALLGGSAGRRAAAWGFFAGRDAALSRAQAVRPVWELPGVSLPGDHALSLPRSSGPFRARVG